MCLTIPKQVICSKKNATQVKVGRKTELVGSLLPVKKGDWVLTQNGIIIRKITAKQAGEINELMK